MTGRIITPIRLPRFLFEYGCLMGGSGFFLVWVGTQTVLYGKVTYDLASFALDAGLSMAAGALWALLMWRFVVPRTKHFQAT